MSNFPDVVNPTTNREVYFSRGKPDVEYVGEREIWLVNEQEQRIKRICGHTLKDMPSGYLCLNDSGFRTNHKGVGYCFWHDYKQEGKSWLQQITKLAKNQNLQTILEDVSDTENKLEDISEELQLQRAIVAWYIDWIGTATETGDPNPDDMDRLMKYVREIRQTKESGARIRGSTQLEEMTVRSFIDQVFTVIVTYLKKRGMSREDITELLHLISIEVIDPMTAQSLNDGKQPTETKDGDIVLEEVKQIESD